MAHHLKVSDVPFDFVAVTENSTIRCKVRSREPVLSHRRDVLLSCETKSISKFGLFKATAAHGRCERTATILVELPIPLKM